MADFKLPYGAEFSPDKIKIKDVLKLAAANEGQPTEKLVSEIAKKYYKKNQTMAANCKNSMVAYEILETGGGVSLSDFGNELVAMKKVQDIYDAMAKHILTYLNGLMFIEAIRRKKIPQEKEAIVNFIGFALLMVLMVVVFFNDIKNAFF